MRRHILLLLALGMIIMMPTTGFALDIEYYTSGGFEPVVQAFRRIALIHGNAGYSALVFSIMMLGLMMSVGQLLNSAVFGGGGSSALKQVIFPGPVNNFV